jgi:hypothetical protein
MKRTRLITTIALISCNFSFSQEVNSQKEIGDDLDLYAVLDAFKDAESIEDFEKTLNGEDSKINNLDLDEDGEIDYIQVNDEGEGDAHAFILSIAISEDETQDIAVIELEKSNDNDATIQIIGDQELYGTDYILEPKNPDEISKRLMTTNLISINVWGWKGVRVVFAPGYSRWHSTSRWNHHPKWWRPWKPVKWAAYNGFHQHHHQNYHPVKTRRCLTAHGFYDKKRRTCKRIVNHHNHHSHHGNNTNGNGHNNHGNHNHHKNQNKQGTNKSENTNKNKQQVNNTKQKQNKRR